MPTLVPEDIEVERTEQNPTVIVVIWRPLTLVEAKGFIQYLVTLTEVSSSKRQARSMMVPWNQNNVTFTDLDRNQAYGVTLATTNFEGDVMHTSK